MPRNRSVIEIKADAFSVRIINLNKFLTVEKHESVLSKQILRCGTSIGANVAESRNAQGSLDFISKLNIALKEADETAYWLKSLCAGGYITQFQYNSMDSDCEEIIKILVKTIKTMKEKYGKR